MNNESIIFFLENAGKGELISIKIGDEAHTFLKNDIFYDTAEFEDSLLIQTKSTNEKYIFDMDSIDSITASPINANKCIERGFDDE